ncbi:MAG: hypothetical protein GY754_26570 [bacterium]|nr:hypothetical protein [bacterium]
MKKNYCINMGMIFLMLGLVFLSGLDLNANGKVKMSKLQVLHKQIKADVCIIYQVGDGREAEFDYLTDIIWRYKEEDILHRSFSQWTKKKFNRMEHYAIRNKVKSFTIGATLVVVGILTEGAGLVVVVPAMVVGKAGKVAWNKKSKNKKKANAEEEMVDLFSNHSVQPGMIKEGITNHANDYETYHQTLTSFGLAININIMEEMNYITRIASEIDLIHNGHINFKGIVKDMNDKKPAKLTNDTVYKAIKLGAAFEKKIIDFECHLDIVTDIQKSMDELVGVMSYIEGHRIKHVEENNNDARVKMFDKAVKESKKGLETVKGYGLMAKMKKFGKAWGSAVGLKALGTFFVSSLNIDTVLAAQPTSMGISAAGGVLNMFMVPVEYKWYDSKFNTWKGAEQQYKKTHDSRTALGRVLKKNLLGCQKLMNSIRDNYNKLGEFVNTKDAFDATGEINESFQDLYAEIYVSIILYRALSEINNDLLKGLKLYARDERYVLDRFTQTAAKSYDKYCELNDIGE